MTKSRSQIGGESSFRGIDYQKKFIAFLCVEMLKNASSIKSITCEHNDDIKVQEDSTIKYYQIKSTSKPSLPKSEIINSIKLFLSIESNVGNNYNEYVIVSNANIGRIKEPHILFPLKDLDEKILTNIISIKEIESREEIIERIHLLKGPALEEIENDIVSDLVRALQDKSYNYKYLRIKDELLHRINDMCPGPTNLGDMTIIRKSETEQYNLNHKTITLDILKTIIEIIKYLLLNKI